MARKKHMKVADEKLVAAVNEEMSAIRTESFSEISDQRIQSNFAFANLQTDATVPTTNMSGVRFFTTPAAVNTLTAIQSKVFCSDKETVKFNSYSMDKQAIEAAQQLGKVVNAVVHKENPGFDIITEMFRSAAVNKNSVAKVVWSEEPEIFERSFVGMDEMEAMQTIAHYEDLGYEVEVVKQKEVTAALIDQDVDIETGELVEVEVASSTVDITLRMTKTRGKVDIMVIPPEEFYINEDTTSINDDPLTRFVAHRKDMYEPDVADMFPDIDVTELSSADDFYDDYETRARHYVDGTTNFTDREVDNQGMRRLSITEAWIRSDRDGDGYAEWRHCFTCGSTLLMDEEWFGPLPFTSFTFFPIPHKFYGLSVYDKIHSYEESATSLIRADIDMARLKNTYRLFAKDGAVDARTLQSGKPGIIRVGKNFDKDDVMEVPSPVGANNTTAILQELRNQIIADIGVDPLNGSISADIEKSGNDASKTAMAIDNSTVKNEGYSRSFAEGALRDIIWLTAIELVKHYEDESVQELVASVTPNMPTLLAGEMGLPAIMRKKDITAMVGLGHQTGPQKIAAAQAVLPLIQQLEANPTAAMYHIISHSLKGFGYDQPEYILGPLEYYKKKSQEMGQQKQLAAQQAQGQIQMQQMQMQIMQQESQYKMKLDQAKAAAEIGEDEAKVQKILAEAEKIRVETILSQQPQAEIKVIS